MQDLMSAKRRLPGFSEKWESTTLPGCPSPCIRRRDPKAREVTDYWGGSIYWMTVKDFAIGSTHSTLETITERGLKNSASTLVSAGTLILGTRMAVGKTAIMSVDVAINQDLKALSFVDECYPPFYKLLFELRQREIEERAGGSTVKGISLNDIRAMIVPKPTREEQVAGRSSYSTTWKPRFVSLRLTSIRRDS